MTDDLISLTSLPGRVQAELTRLRAERQVFTAEQDRLKSLLAATEQELKAALSAAKEQANQSRQTEELAERVRLLEQDNSEHLAALAALQRSEQQLQQRCRAMDAELASGRAASARADVLQSDLRIMYGERDQLRAELLACREERDRLRLRLLDAELLLSAGSAPAGSAPAESTPEAATLADPHHEDSPDIDQPSDIDQPRETARVLQAEQRVAELTRELSAIKQTMSWRVTAPLRALRRRARRP